MDSFTITFENDRCAMTDNTTDKAAIWTRIWWTCDDKTTFKFCGSLKELND